MQFDEKNEQTTLKILIDQLKPFLFKKKNLVMLIKESQWVNMRLMNTIEDTAAVQHSYSHKSALLPAWDGTTHSLPKYAP